MFRKSSDIDFLKTGRVVIDADGIPVDVPDRSDMDAADNALDEKIDARVPAGLALRLDTTVGTRVLAGDTMIYGDTGWRDIGSLLPGSTGLMLLRRTGDVVEFAVNAFDNTSGTQADFTLPLGYRVGKTTHTLLYDANPTVWSLTSGYVKIGNRAIQGSKHAVWMTSDPWPTTLPGLPA